MNILGKKTLSESIGQSFGVLTVVGRNQSNNSSRIKVDCSCSLCGELSTKELHTIKRDLPQSCGPKCARLKKAKDVLGRTFSILKVISVVEDGYVGRTKVNCECRICGRISVKTLNNVMNRRYKKCGVSCKYDDIAVQPTNNLSGHPLYSIHRNMLSRCHNKMDKSYHHYGGRGIAVCEEWLDIENFISDMGDSHQTGLTLDRIDNDKGYSPDNCQWASHHDQANNKRNTVMIDTPDGVMSAAHASKQYGIPYGRLKNRYYSGITDSKLLSKTDLRRKVND